MTALPDLRLRHLETVLTIVNRLSQNSFTIRGWSVTLVSAIFAIVATQGDGRPNLILLTLVPAWIFWALDAYYLYQERLFRALYDAVARSLQDDAAAGGGHDDAAAIEVPLFDMNLRPYRNSTAPWWKTALAPHVAAIPVTLSLLVTCFWIASW